MIKDAYVINLKDRYDRWLQVQHNFKGTGIKLHRWNAINGKDLTDQQIKNITTMQCYFTCSKGMIGCWLSHYLLWKHIVDHAIHRVLILEDDVEIVPGFVDKLKDALNKVPLQYDMVLLGCEGSCDLENPFYNLLYKPNKVLNERVVIPSFPSSLHAYVLSLTGARKIVQYCQSNKINKPVDTWLAEVIFPHGLKIYAIQPSLVNQQETNRHSNSDIIQTSHPIFDNIMAPIKITDKVNMSYYLNHEVTHSRHLNIYIKLYTVLFIVLAIFIPVQFLVAIFAIEMTIVKRCSYPQILFDLFLVLLVGFIKNRLVF